MSLSYFLKDNIKKKIIPVVLYLMVGFIINLAPNVDHILYIYAFLSIIYVVIIHQIDLSFLHNKRRIIYMKSKPHNLFRHIMMFTLFNYIVFLIMVTPIIIFLYSSNSFYDDFPYTYTVLLSIIGLLIINIASLISGNSLVSLVIAGIIAGLPFIYLAGLYLFMSFITSMLPGFSSNIVFQYMFNFNWEYITSTIYMLYYNGEITYQYIILWIVYFFIGVFLIRHLVIKRKNENVVNYILSSKVTTVLTISLSLFVSIFFADQLFYNYTFTTKLIVFITLFVVSIYMLNVILKKSFILPKKLVTSIFTSISIISIGLVLIYIGFSSKVNYIPDINDIKSVSIGSPYDNNTHMMDDEVINAILEYHDYLVDNIKFDSNSRGYYSTVRIQYTLTNGKKITRDYNVKNRGIRFVENIINTKAFKETILPVNINNYSEYDITVQLEKVTNGKNVYTNRFVPSNNIMESIITNMEKDISNTHFTLLNVNFQTSNILPHRSNDMYHLYLIVDGEYYYYPIDYDLENIYYYLEVYYPQDL